MKRLSTLLAAMLLWSLIACKNNAADEGYSNTNSPLLQKKTTNYTTSAADSAGMPQADNKTRTGTPDKSQTKEDWDKKIIRTGNLTMEVKNYKTFNELVHSGIKQFGGYIATEEQNQSDYKIENVVTIKVPVDQFDNAVAALTPPTEKTVEKKISSEDVTGELVDTKSRMEAKKRVRDRYLDLLKQAKNMEEILQVQNEIDGIQENIEAAAGRIGYLGHAASFSTINIHFYQFLIAPVNNTDPSYGYRIIESFKSGLHWFAELFVWLVSLWPLWTGIAAAWWVIKKRTVFLKRQKQVSYDKIG